jgi:hypothetical protein
MAKARISSPDLVWVFTEKLRSFGDCANVSIAIIPAEDGWMAIASQKAFGWASSLRPAHQADSEAAS